MIPLIVFLLVTSATTQTSPTGDGERPTLKVKSGKNTAAWTPSEMQARRNKEIAEQSQKTGLDSNYIRALLDIEGFSGVPFHVQLIDTVTLQARKQVLLVGSSVGVPRRMGVHVLDDSARPNRVWAAFEVSADQNFCSVAAAAHPPTAYATKSGVILVKIPVRAAPESRSAVSELLVAEFIWSGTTYTLGSVHRYANYRWTGERWEEEPR